jgi:hypothetical protein
MKPRSAGMSRHPSVTSSRTPLILEAPSSHLYPGIIVKTVAEEGEALPRRRMARCLVVFADGSSAAARLRREGDVYLIEVEACRTERGTPIGPRFWRVASMRGIRGIFEFRLLAGPRPFQQK